MQSIRFWATFTLVAIIGTSIAVTVIAQEPTPDLVLQNKGLIRAGPLYVVDAERGFVDGMAKIQPRYAEMEALLPEAGCGRAEPERI